MKEVILSKSELEKVTGAESECSTMAADEWHESGQSSPVACLVCGLESVGKTQLLASLSGSSSVSENFRGSTFACEAFRAGGVKWIDSPGLLRESETAASRAVIEEITEADRVMLVVRIDRARDELNAMLKVVAGKPGFIVLTFADQSEDAGREYAKQLSRTLGLKVVSVDARKLKNAEIEAIKALALTPLEESVRFPEVPPDSLPSPVVKEEARDSVLGRIASFPPAALVLLFLPAWVAVTNANRVADWFYDPLARLIEPVLSAVTTWPSLPASLMGGDYGLLAMFPFLVLYAAPTIIVFSVMLAVYKSTGLIDRISLALHPWLRPFGIGGRDLVRVIMGFGCNVPAIVSTRNCHTCSRGACVSAISFGAACSYQLPATLAVFAAAGMAGAGMVYLAVLSVTTLVYLRFTTPKALRLASNHLIIQQPDTLQPPSWQSVWREVSGNIRQFVLMAFPVFVVICFAASVLEWLGLFTLLSQVSAPAMALFNLPSEAASSVILGAVRKDGIAIGLLGGGDSGLKVAMESPVQVFTAVYLAGVLLPCLVTVFTIAREMSWSFATKLCAKQIAWASGFGVVIAWGGALVF